MPKITCIISQAKYRGGGRYGQVLEAAVPMQEPGTEYNSLVFKFLNRLPFPFTLTRSYDIFIAPDFEFPFNNKHLLIIKDMKDTPNREILISPQYNSMMFLVIFRIAYDTGLIKLKIV
jgi:hypothetical protein